MPSPSVRWPSEDADPAPLGQPIKFAYSGVTAPNRFLKASLTERISSWDPSNIGARGVPSPELINLYRRWGEGGYGIILSGNILIDPEHLEAAGNPVISPNNPFEGERFEAFAELAREAKAHGSLCLGQVNHPGRQVEKSMNEHPISASDVQLEATAMGMKFGKPRAATQENIDGFIEGFAHAAEYLEKAGFDGIQLHCAHGYLLSQFISTTTNHRTDKYGGSIANRTRILVEIATEIRARTSSAFSIAIKLNSVEFQQSGLQPEDALEICTILQASGFDWVELSGGTYEKLAWDHSLYEKRESTRRREAFFLEFADMIAPRLETTKIYVTGGFKTVGAMVDALKTIDGVGLGRPACQEPCLPKLIMSGKVKGAIQQRFDEGDFGVQVIAAGTQMQQVSRDREPIDLSLKENADGFMKDLETFVGRRKADTDRKLQGYVDVVSVESVPYGTAASGLTLGKEVGETAGFKL